MTVAAWFVQVGALNEVHHLWQFADLEERRSRREQSWGVQGWADTVRLYFSKIALPVGAYADFLPFSINRSTRRSR